MSKRKPPVPVDARWRAVDDEGGVAEIWLERREETKQRVFEMWKWSFRYRDGSGRFGDWAPTFRKCREEASLYMRSRARFRRLQDRDLT